MERVTNEHVRAAAEKNNVRMWEIAARLGISEPQFFRWLRFEFDEDRKQKVLSVIEEIAAERSIGNGSGV